MFEEGGVDINWRGVFKEGGGVFKEGGVDIGGGV